MASEDPIGENNPTPDTDREANVQSSNPPPNVPPVASVPNFPPSHPYCEIAYTTEKNWWNKWKPFAEIGGIVLLAIYTAFTILMYCANNKAAKAAKGAANAATCAAKAAQEQTALMKQQLVGTQAAVVKVADYPSIYPLGNLFRVDLAFANSGHVLARNIRMNVEVTTREVKTGKVVEVLTNCSSQLEVLAPEDKPRKISQPCDFPVISQKWSNIPTLKHTIAIDGTFSYWDGFEESEPQAICLRYVPNGVKTAFGTNEGDGRFFSCTDYPGAVAYLKARIAGVEHPERLDQ